MTVQNPRFLQKNPRAHAWVIVLILLWAILVGTGSPVHADDPEEPDGSSGRVSIAVTDMTPTMVGEDDTVEMTVRVTNHSAEDLTAARLSLSIVRYKLSSTDILKKWFTGSQELLVPTFLTSIDLEEELLAGEGRTLTLSVPAEDLRLLSYPDAAGPRGLIVRLQDLPSGREIDSMRTFLLWFPDPNVEPVRISVLTPITGPVPTPLAKPAWKKRINGETRAEERLNRLLAATGDYKGVTWVVDPALVDAAMGETGDDGTGSPPSAANSSEWAQELLTSATGREVFSLDPFDPDVTALAHAGVHPFLAASNRNDTSAITGWRDDLTLPPSDVVDLTTVEAAVEQDRNLILVRSGLTPISPPRLPDRGATAFVQTPAGPATALLPDDELSALFATPDTTTNRSIFAARQLLLAHLAAIRVENPTEPAHLLLTTGRDWLPNSADTSFILDGLESSPFINLEPLSRLLGGRTSDVDRTPLPVSAPEEDGAISSRELLQARGQANEVQAIADTAAKSSEVNSPYLEAMAATTAVQWRADPATRAGELRDATALGESVLSSLTVVPGSTVNLISDHGDLPVTVRNDLVQDATIQVRLSPNDRRLQTDKVVPVTVPAQSAAQVNVPATAIGSGNVEVGVQILAPDGQELDQSNFTVRVRADWENTGTAVLAGLLLLALILGVIRTIRRGKKPTRMEPVTSPSSDATDSDGGSNA